MIEEILKQQNIIISVTNEQLNEFANQILNGARSIYEKKEEPERYLSRKETAELLEVDQSTLFRWKRNNYLTDLEIGGKRRYRMSDINKILGKGAIA